MNTNILGKGFVLCVSALLTVVFSNAYATSSGNYGSPSLPTPAELTPQQTLGKFIFFDENLSEPAGQSCASCHMPNAGFADPDSNLPVSEGVIPDRFGSRNSPSAAYASFSPPFSYDTNTSIAKGGQFWDGRRATLAEQAKDPFLNPVEMNNPDKLSVLMDIQGSSYAPMFETLCGPMNDIDTAYSCMAEAIAAYESSTELNPFTSKFDYVLAGLARFSAQEAEGMSLFNGRAMCSQCHTSTVVMTGDNTGGNIGHSGNMGHGGNNGYMNQCGESEHDGHHHGKRKHDGDHKRGHHKHRRHGGHTGGCGSNTPKEPVLFTDFQYYNLGLPRNTEFPFKDISAPDGGSNPGPIFPGSGNGSGGNTGGGSQSNQNTALSQIDLGLGGVLHIRSENGRFKVPTLRNVELTTPYMHNGVLKTLKEVVRFYNLRDTGAWGLPEVFENMEQRRVGNLGLSSAQEDAIVAFLLTLTDGHVADNNGGGYGQGHGHKKDHHKKHSKKYKRDDDDDHKKYSKRYKRDDDDDHKKYSKRYKRDDDDDHKKYSKKYKRDDDDDHKKHSKKYKRDDDDNYRNASYRY